MAAEALALTAGGPGAALTVDPDNDSVSEQPGRYQRSFAGLVGAILVTLLVIGAFVAFRATFRDQAAQRPVPVDYLAVVAAGQDAGSSVAYPADLPDGWIATSVDLTPGEDPSWGVGMLTAEEDFAGVRQEAADVEDLLATYLDEDPHDIQRLGEVELDSEVAATWSAYTDSGGDRAYAAELDGQVVLVYGSASEADLRSVVARLTTAPVAE